MAAVMTGPEHYRQAEQLLGHAAAMAAENVGPGDVPELLERVRLDTEMAIGHGLLALAAAIGLSAKMGVADESAWRDAAGTPLGT
jgi:hypothetical protein